MSEVATDQHRQAATSLRQLLSAIQQAEDLISIGAYQTGSNPDVDAAIHLEEPIRRFLQQVAKESGSLNQALDGLIRLRDLRNGTSVTGSPSLRFDRDVTDF
jgi:flagellar biosynthesis/type III secretory pathway ATPase